MGTVIYVSGQCPNCERFVKTLRRFAVQAKIVNIDTKPVDGLTAVPTVVSGRKVMVGTDAFEWLQSFEADLPLDAYATVLGEGAGGLSYTDLETDETVDATPFTMF